LKRNALVAALLIVVIAATAAAQDEEPQPAEYLPATEKALGLPQAVRAVNLDGAFQAMYNLDFENAESEVQQFIAEQPGNPVGPAARAASVLFSIFEKQKVLQSELFSSDQKYEQQATVAPDRALLDQFDSALRQAEEQSRQALTRNASDQDALFALTLVYGLRADHAALVERRDFAALRFANTGNGWARKLLSRSPEFYDAYVATGIQQYLVSLRPASVRWMLRLGGIKGDQDEGLGELELAANKGRYLAPFAQILLAIANLRKGNPAEARRLLDGLHQQFPSNPLFAEEIDHLRRSSAGDLAILGTSIKGQE
jgi:predicted Zn-dependent protease